MTIKPIEEFTQLEIAEMRRRLRDDGEQAVKWKPWLSGRVSAHVANVLGRAYRNRELTKPITELTDEELLRVRGIWTKSLVQIRLGLAQALKELADRINYTEKGEQMKLKPNQIADIEALIDEGTVAEVRLTQGGFIVTRRPAKEHDIQFPYAMLCGEDPCQLTLTIQKPGDYPVVLGTFPLPAKYWVEAIKGYKGEGD